MIQGFHLQLVLIALLVIVNRTGADEPKKEPESKPVEPTKEHLVAAKEAYAKHGAFYEASDDPVMKNYLASHIFHLPGTTTDAKLKGIPDLPFHFALAIHSHQVTDVGVQELKNLKNLTYVSLSETKITDASMKSLNEIKSLRLLSLKYTRVTDAGLKDLKGLTNLKVLVLGNARNVTPPANFAETPVTDAGVEELQRALPHCRIHR